MQLEKWAERRILILGMTYPSETSWNWGRSHQ